MILWFTKPHGVCYVTAKFFEKSAAPSAIEAVYSLDILPTTNQPARCHMTRKIILCVFITIKKLEFYMNLKIWPCKAVGLRNCSSGVLL